MINRVRRAALVVAATSITACAGGGETETLDTTARTTDQVVSADVFTSTVGDSTPSETAVPESTVEPRPEFADRPLVDVCPPTIVVQLDGLPSVAHGPLYALVGPNGAVDADRQSVSGPITRADGTVESVTLELRAGGPAVGFHTGLSLLAADPSILIVEASTAEIAASEPAVTGVVALTDVSHKMIMWDPEALPNVTTTADLGASGTNILSFAGEPFIEYLAGQGILDPAHLVEGFDGGPAAFVADAATIAQQGDSLIDPFLYPSLPQFGRQIAFGLAADDGWAAYDDTLAVRAADLDGLADCLSIFVPIVQDSIVAYASTPSATNPGMGLIRSAFNPLARIGSEILDQGAASAVATGTFGNGPDGIVGTFDMDRMASFLTALDSPADPANIATNRFTQPDRAI